MNCMISVKILLLFFVFLLVCIPQVDAQSLNRQEILDEPNDLILHNTNPTATLNINDEKITLPNQLSLNKCLSHKGALQTDITAYSYLIDGGMLNVTLWLSDGIENQIEYSKPLTSESVYTDSWQYLTYTMSIDINSVYETGSDYFYTVHWDPIEQTWKSSLEEGSASGVKRYLDIHDITNPFEDGKNYLLFSLDLDKIGNPDQFNLILQTYNAFLDDDGKFCQLLDIGNWAQNPPPEFDISTIPNPIILKQGDDAIVEIRIQSKTNVKSTVQFTVGKSDELEMDFLTNTAYVPPNGIGVAVLHIRANDDAHSRSYTIPLIGHFTFETSSKIRGGSLVQNSKNIDVVDQSNIIITVNPQMTFDERFSSFMGVYGSIITLAGGVVGGTFLKFWLDKRHKKKTDEQKTSDKPQ